MHLHMRGLLKNSQMAVSSLKSLFASFREAAYYRNCTKENGEPFGSWQEFVEYRDPFGLGLPVSVVEAIMAEPDEQKLIADVVASVPALAKPGRPPKGSENPDRASRFPMGTNSPRYQLARIKRDHPDLAARIQAGELSVRDAAKQVGIVKPRKPSTDLDALRTAWRRASEESRRAFLRELGAPV